MFEFIILKRKPPDVLKKLWGQNRRPHTQKVKEVILEQILARPIIKTINRLIWVKVIMGKEAHNNSTTYR